MVGWNVAATKLVAGKASVKDKYVLVLKPLQLYCFVNEHDEFLNV